MGDGVLDVSGVLAGFVALIGYTAALVSFKLIPVGAASALRELSVVFGTLIARFWLKEKVDAKRVAGVAIVVVGSVLIGVGM